MTNPTCPYCRRTIPQGVVRHWTGITSRQASAMRLPGVWAHPECYERRKATERRKRRAPRVMQTAMAVSVYEEGAEHGTEL